jgi:hypothetical protein
MTRSGFLRVFAAAMQVEPLRPQYAHFKDAEIRLVRDFFRPGGGNPPPVQVKKEPLPAAVAKQIRRGGTLPENLKTETFPTALAKQLPEPPKDYQRLLFHRWVLLIQSESRLIVDLIDLI